MGELGQPSFKFCLVCDCNFKESLAAHNCTPIHKNNLSSFLERNQQTIIQFYNQMKTPVLASSISQIPSTPFWCPFCESEYFYHNQEFYCTDIYRHLAGKKHENNVKKFLKEYVKAKLLKQRFKKKHFRIAQGALQKYLQKVGSFERENPAEIKPEAEPVPKEEILPNIEIDGHSHQSEKKQELKVHPWQQVENWDSVREEIKELVRKANEISSKKMNKNPKRHKNIEKYLPHKKVYLPNFGGVWEAGPRSATSFQYYQQNLQEKKADTTTKDS